jgi:hypothetical protein
LSGELITTHIGGAALFQTPHTSERAKAASAQIRQGAK